MCDCADSWFTADEDDDSSLGSALVTCGTNVFETLYLTNVGSAAAEESSL